MVSLPPLHLIENCQQSVPQGAAGGWRCGGQPKDLTYVAAGDAGVLPRAGLAVRRAHCTGPTCAHKRLIPNLMATELGAGFDGGPYAVDIEEAGRPRGADGHLLPCRAAERPEIHERELSSRV